MATVSDLSVKVSAKTASFQSGMQRAQSGLSGLRNDAIQTAGAMQLFQGRMDEAGDEAQTAGAKAGASSGGFMALAGSAATAEVSFGSMSVMTIATLIPSLLALSTVVAPLVAALGGFAVVAGSIVGIGLAGFMGAVMTNGEQLNGTFQKLKSTIQNEFAPVFDIFAGVLDRLMQRLIEIIPQLVPAENVIRRIAGQFESLGVSIINMLPAFVDLAVTLADQFLPPFVRWAESILPKVPGMMQSLIPIMLQVGNALAPLAQAFIKMAPAMTRFGMTVLNIITPALTTAANIITRAMQAVNGLDKRTAALATALTILSPIIAKVTLALAGLSAPILAAVAAMATFVSAWTRGWNKTKQTISTGVSFITNALDKIWAWLVNNGPRLIQRTISIFQSMIRDAATWIINNGPGLVQEAFRLVGQAIRFVVKDIYNAITGNGDSILKSIIVDFGSWLINNGPGILKGAITTTFAVITAAARGLYRGLIGGEGSLFNGMFGDIASYIKNGAKNLITGAIDTLVEGAKSAFNYLIGTGDGTLIGDVKSAFGDVATWIKDKWSIVETIGGAFKGAGEAVANNFKAAFNGIIDDNIRIPEVTIGGGEIMGQDIPEVTLGGDSIDLPQLDTGGYIEQGGLAQLHAGEQVVPAAKVDRDGGGGDGGKTVNIEVDARGSEDPSQTKRNAKRGLSSALDAYNV